MKRILFLGLTAASITFAEAAVPVMKTSNKDVLMKTGKGGINKCSSSINNGISIGETIRKKASESKGSNDYLLYENFSGWDEKNSKWLPEGWALEHKGTCSMDYSWSVFAPNMYYPAIHDGKYCFCVSFTEKPQDEWLITPEFTPKENMLLSYYMLNRPLLFYSMENLDWGTKEYNGDKIVAFTLQILIQEEGGEWQILRDHAEEWKNCNYHELFDASNTSALEKQTVDLNAYADKKVKIAFRYLGADGDMMMLDAVGVGYPTLDAVWYMEPTNSLYWGFSKDSYFYQPATDIAYYPANTGIIWPNMSEEDASYSWQYDANNNSGFKAEEDEYELSLTYGNDEEGQTPTLYESPILTAIAPERIDGVYQSPVKYFQIGGKTSFTGADGTFDFTLFQFPMINQDLAYKGVMDDKLGAYSIPVYGYNEFSNDYWLNYSLNGEEALEGDYSHLIGIGNVYFASHDVALKVNGISVYGWGRIWDDAELTATIYALDSEMHTAYDTYTVVGRATLSGKDILALDDKRYKDYIYLPFKFDETVNVQASEEHPAFLIMLEGFNSDKVDYFAPLHNYLPIDNGFSAGYMLHEINLQGHTGDDAYKSLKSTQYVENGTYYTHPVTFAIGLDAEYATESTAVEAIGASEGSEVTYDLNGRQVSAASASGIYIVKSADGSVRKVIR